MKPGAVTVPIAMRDLNNSPVTGATLACTVSIDGAAFAASINSAAEVSGGDYSLALTAGERGTHYTRVKATNGTYTTLVTVTTDEAMRGTDGALLAEDYIAPPTDYAKPADVQVTVNPTLTPEESAKLLGAAQEATLEAVKLRTDTLDAATGTLTLSFRLLLDSDGDGIADVPAVGVGGVTCHLLAHGTHTRVRESATTDSQGYVYWHGLAAGTYDVDPDAAGYEGVTVAVTIPEVT